MGAARQGALTGSDRPGVESPWERPPGWCNRLSFLLFWLGFGGLLRLYFRLRVIDHPKIDGPYVLVANHVSYLDPLLLGAASRRRITYMMTQVIYRSPITGWFYRWNRAIPLSVRGNNREGLRAARAVLRRGGVLGIFPEGGISRDGRPMLGNPGAVSLVLTEGVPVVPVGIIGAERALPVLARVPRPVSVTIRFGDPIAPDELAPPGLDRKARLARATQLIMARIAALTGQRSREEELLLAGRG